MKTHLVDIHNRENGLIQEFCFAEKVKRLMRLPFFHSRTFFKLFL